MAVWAAGIGWWLDQAQTGDRFIAPLILETVRLAAWTAVLTGISRETIAPALVLTVHAYWATWLLSAALLFWPVLPETARLEPSNVLVYGGLGAALILLILIEHVHRQSSHLGRRVLAPLNIGLGVLCVYDLFVYSQAILFGGLSFTFWVARSLVALAAIPAIALAARRNPVWSLDVFVSRQAVMFTTALLATGIYLVSMALVGIALREWDGRWGIAANVVFIGGALAVLASILFSDMARRRFRVFLAKHFYRNKYDYRREWLRFVRTLSLADSEGIRRTSIRAIAQILESPGGVLFGRTEDGYFSPAAAWPMQLSDLQMLADVPADDGLLRRLRDSEWVIDLRELAQQPENYQNLRVPAPIARLPGARLVAPLLLQLELTGFVVLLEPPTPFEATFEDYDLLKTVGRHVATLLAQHAADEKLAEVRQFDAYNRLTAFLMHDLKNAVAQLELVVRNAERHRHNPEFIDDALETTAGAVQRIRSLIVQLSTGGATAPPQRVFIEPLLAKVVAQCGDRLPVPRLVCTLAPESSILADPDRFAANLEHLIRNAQDSSARDGEVTVEAHLRDGLVRIAVIDSGQGMSADFVRERLFRPFDSTKGSKGMGIGAYQVRQYVLQLGGRVAVTSSPGAGTRFEMMLPTSRRVDTEEEETEGVQRAG
jgi:putative PEP-CTERM system histidine kinase